METIGDFSKEDFAEMAIVVIMSHGNDGSTMGADGVPVAIEDILTKFNNKNAPQLTGKPKLFIFAHCRF
jgi:hypothetical protein